MPEKAIDQLQNIFPDISEKNLILMVDHLEAVLQANRTTNLTRITDEQSAKVLHIEDSLIGVPELDAAPAGKYADIGSGGGYPGIPLSIVTGRETLLVDSVKKKMEILNSIIDALGLSHQISTYGGRVEDLALEMSEQFAVVTARALSSLPSLLELSSPLLFLSGHLICYKAQILESELEQAISIEVKTGMKLISDRQALLSDNQTTRRIIVFKKVAEPTVKLPRRPGMAQKRPYTK